jgi:murein tripeptide amidase MpaA
MAEFQSTENQNWVINLDMALVAQHLAKDPIFIAEISKEVRNQMTKDVRWMGNLFAKWASTNIPAPSTKKRSQ